jgi:hypothetical protein
MVDHGRGFHNPRIGRSRARAAATLGPHDPRLFLGLANVQHALVLLELPQVRLRHIVLALALSKAMRSSSDESLDVVNERIGHRRYRRRRRKPLALMDPQVPHRLQVRHIDVEVHPIDSIASYSRST